jgi:glycosyltransferase involved in cell wall biosynthesis
MPAEMRSVSVCGLVATYRRPDWLNITLGALRSQTRPLDHVIVVDNDPARSAEAVAVAMGAEYVHAGENLGPAGAWGLGVETATGRFPWVMLIDDDDPPAGRRVVESLVEFFVLARSLEPNCAGVGPSGSTFDRRRGRSHRPDILSADRLLPVDWIGSGMFPLYDLGAINRAGGVDSSLFWGFEDLDLGLRLHSAGYLLFRDRDHCVGEPLAVPPKVAGAAASPWRRYYATRNLVRIVARESSRLWAVFVAGRSILGAAVRSPRRRLDATRAATLGALDAARARTGRTVPPDQ